MEREAGTVLRAVLRSSLPGAGCEPLVLFSDLLSGWNHQFTKALKGYLMQAREDGSATDAYCASTRTCV